MTVNKTPIIALVVEDNPGDSLLIEEYLTEFFEHPQIVNTPTFAEAVERFAEREDWEVILLDLSLPDKSGEELIREMTALAPGVPVIVLTGYDDLSFSIKSLAMGISDYLMKDQLSPLILYKSIVYGIERQRASRQLRESEKRYRDLFQLSPQPMWVLDLETCAFLDVNEAATRHYGYKREIFLAMTLSDLQKQSDTDIMMNVMRQAIGGNYHLLGEAKHVKNGGDVIYVDLVGHPLLFNGRNAELLLGTDITEKKKAGERLLAATVTAEDNERKRIAQDIHDGLQQTLVTAMLNIEPVTEEVQHLSENVRERFLRGYSYLNQGINETRSIAHQLMPKAIEDFGYAGAVRNMLDHLHTSTQFHYHDNLGNDRLPRLLEVGLYRITQEAITNILKYANASEAFIQLVRRADGANLTIEDNGDGFEMKGKGLETRQGLRFMQSRVSSLGGTLEISSEIGKGTLIFVDVPLIEN